MITILGLFNAIAFTIISVFHFYWAFGGKRGINAALPQFEGDKKVFLPSTLMTAGVAMIFLGIAVFTLYSIKFLDFHVPDFLKNYGLYCLTAGMIIRALGDFRYVGFLKTVKNTEITIFCYYHELCSSYKQSRILVYV